MSEFSWCQDLGPEPSQRLSAVTSIRSHPASSAMIPSNSLRSDNHLARASIEAVSLIKSWL